MTSAELTIAIVDDDETVRRALRRMITSFSYSSLEFASGEALLTSQDLRRLSCVLLDLHMPGLNGIDVLHRMRGQGHAVPIIIITGGDQPKLRQKCMSAGASGYFVKPVDRDAVLSMIQSFLGKPLPKMTS